MADPSGAQQLFDMWKRQVEEGTQAWARMMTQTSPPGGGDPAALWRPFLDQGFQHWARVFAQTPVSPDLMTQWKQILDHEERLERVEEGVTAILHRLEQLARMLTDRERGTRGEREKEPR